MGHQVGDWDRHLGSGSARAALAHRLLFTCCGPCVCRVCMRVEIVSNVTLHYQGYNESLLKWI